MKLRLLDVAALELDEAVQWYRDRDDALSDRLLAEFADARDGILAHPHAWHPVNHDVRRYRLKRFPYALIYVVEGDEIIVVAVAHAKRRPGYWRERLSQE